MLSPTFDDYPNKNKYGIDLHPQLFQKEYIALIVSISRQVESKEDSDD